MKNHFGKILMVALFAVLAMGGGVSATTTVSACGFLNTANEAYVLNQSIAVNGSTCITFNATNITLDCGGFTITGNNTANTVGIYSTFANSTLKNCKVKAFNYGIFFSGVVDGQIQDTFANTTLAGGYAIGLNVTTNVNVTRVNTSVSNAYALRIYGASVNNIVTDYIPVCIAYNTQYESGIDLATTIGTQIIRMNHTNSGCYNAIQGSGDKNLTIRDSTLISSTGTSVVAISSTSSNGGIRLVNNSIKTTSAMNLLDFTQSTPGVFGNIVANNTFDYNRSDERHLIMLSNGANSVVFQNNTFIANDYASTSYAAISFDNSCTGISICLNNFTKVKEKYVSGHSSSSGNSLNCSYGGLNQGNIYGNVINGSVVIQGDVNSSITGFYIGKQGAGYPYTNVTSLGKITGDASLIDYAPLTNDSRTNTGSNITAISTTPSSPTKASTISCNLTAIDAEQATLNVTGNWSKNGTVLLAFTYSGLANNTATLVANLTSGNFSKGDNISCSAMAFDGTAYSSLNTSTNVTVLNTAPSGAVANNLTDAASSHSFTVNGTVTDIDGGTDIVASNCTASAGTCTYVSNSTSGNTFTVMYNVTGTAPSNATVSIGFTDASASYSEATSASHAFPDHAMSLTAPTIAPTTAYINSTLTATPGNCTDLDGDGCASTYQWYENGTAIAGATGLTLGAGNFSRYGNVSFGQIVSNSTWASSTAANNSSVLTISDAPPVIAVSISPTPIYSTTVPKGFCNASDADNDTQQYLWKGYLNGAVNFTGNSSNWTAGVAVNVANFTMAFANGDNLTFECQAFDGANYSSAVNSTTYQVQTANYSEGSVAQTTATLGAVVHWSKTVTVNNGTGSISVNLTQLGIENSTTIKNSTGGAVANSGNYTHLVFNVSSLQGPYTIDWYTEAYQISEQAVDYGLGGQLEKRLLVYSQYSQNVSLLLSYSTVGLSNLGLLECVNDTDAACNISSGYTTQTIVMVSDAMTSSQSLTSNETVYILTYTLFNPSPGESAPAGNSGSSTTIINNLINQTQDDAQEKLPTVVGSGQDAIAKFIGAWDSFVKGKLRWPGIFVIPIYLIMVVGVLVAMFLRALISFGTSGGGAVLAGFPYVDLILFFLVAMIGASLGTAYWGSLFV